MNATIDVAPSENYTKVLAPTIHILHDIQPQVEGYHSEYDDTDNHITDGSSKEEGEVVRKQRR